VDEFQNFSTDSFASILSEARKYRLNLIVANQFIGQLTDEIREAVFGNIGTIVAHRMGPEDAEFMVKQFAPVFDVSDLVNIPNYNAVMRLDDRRAAEPAVYAARFGRRFQQRRRRLGPRRWLGPRRRLQ
jgi:hypothetical protein